MLTKKQGWWLGIAGSIASLIGLGLYFLPPPVYESRTSSSSGRGGSSIKITSESECSPSLTGVKVTGSLVVCNQKASQHEYLSGDSKAEASAPNMPIASPSSIQRQSERQNELNEKNTNSDLGAKPAQKQSIVQNVTGNNNVAIGNSGGNITIETIKR